MILCDIGNTNFHFEIENKLIDTKNCDIKDKKIYFISVNEEKKKELLKLNPNSIDLSNYISFDTSYKGLGIDRIMVCKTVKDGIVIDAGSAITIDIMENNFHKGGYILPGLYVLNRSYANISEKLDIKFNLNINDKLPTNTKDAISFGAIKMIVEFIKSLNVDKLYFTGGDGEYLSKFFKNSIYIKDLVFRGMKQTIKENNL